jgi:hypothetical protein
MLIQNWISLFDSMTHLSDPPNRSSQTCLIVESFTYVLETLKKIDRLASRQPNFLTLFRAGRRGKLDLD